MTHGARAHHAAVSFPLLVRNRRFVNIHRDSTRRMPQQILDSFGVSPVLPEQRRARSPLQPPACAAPCNTASHWHVRERGVALSSRTSASVRATLRNRLYSLIRGNGRSQRSSRFISNDSVRGQVSSPEVSIPQSRRHHPEPAILRSPSDTRLPYRLCDCDHIRREVD